MAEGAPPVFILWSTTFIPHPNSQGEGGADADRSILQGCPKGLSCSKGFAVYVTAPKNTASLGEASKPHECCKYTPVMSQLWAEQVRIWLHDDLQEHWLITARAQPPLLSQNINVSRCPCSASLLSTLTWNSLLGILGVELAEKAVYSSKQVGLEFDQGIASFFYLSINADWIHIHLNFEQSEEC